MSNSVQEIIQKRREADAAAAAAMPTSPEQEGDKFFSILVGETGEENFLELQSKEGLHTYFSYGNLLWFAYDAEDGIYLDFSGFTVHVQGRGLYPKLANGLKQKRVGWIREADSEMQDHKGNETFISSITISPPDNWEAPQTSEK